VTRECLKNGQNSFAHETSQLKSPSTRCLKDRFLSSSNFASTRPQAIQQQARSSHRIARDPSRPAERGRRLCKKLHSDRELRHRGKGENDFFINFLQETPILAIFISLAGYGRPVTTIPYWRG